MARLKIKPYRKGIQEAALNSPEVRAAIDAIGAQVAAHAAANSDVIRHGTGETGLRVEESSYRTDRVAVAVTLAGPDGIGVEAKYGPLSQAARSVGLQVKETHLHVKAGSRRRAAAASRLKRKARAAELSKTRRGRAVLDSERRKPKTLAGRALKAQKTRSKARSKRKRKR